MADVINGDFGNGREALEGLERIFGEAAGLKVGLRRIVAPHGNELQVTVGAQALSVPRSVAVVLANSAGEDEADRIGKAVLKALQLAEAAHKAVVSSGSNVAASRNRQILLLETTRHIAAAICAPSCLNR